jgi:hypothetical protein
VAHHYAGDDLIVRKIEVGTMENNVYVLECPETHEALLVDGCFEADKILEGAEGARLVNHSNARAHGSRPGARRIEGSSECSGSRSSRGRLPDFYRR